MRTAGHIAQALMISVLLSGCQLLKITPVPPPPPTAEAQSITRAQTFGLQPLGTVAVTRRGAPSDVEAAIAARASQLGAHYYMITALDETGIPGLWRAQAVLYR